MCVDIRKNNDIIRWWVYYYVSGAPNRDTSVWEAGPGYRQPDVCISVEGSGLWACELLGMAAFKFAWHRVTGKHVLASAYHLEKGRL